MVTMTLVTVPLMDRVGRRLLHLLGLAGMFLMTILIIIAQGYNHSSPPREQTIKCHFKQKKLLFDNSLHSVGCTYASHIISDLADPNNYLCSSIRIRPFVFTENCHQGVEESCENMSATTEQKLLYLFF